MHKSPVKTKLFGLPVTDALRSERWRISSTLSFCAISRSDRVSIHLWQFNSVAPQNATKYMFVCWVSGPEVRFTTAWGVNDVEHSVGGIVNHVRQMLPTPARGDFRPDPNGGIPWIQFATEIDPESLVWTNPAVPGSPESDVRTVQDMLTFVSCLGEDLDESLSRAAAVLSAPDESDEDKRMHMVYGLTIAKLCRDKEIEAVYWPTNIWLEAQDESDIFLDTIIPPHYTPVGPELWYPERKVPLQFPLDDPRRKWELSGFDITAIILLPTHTEGRDVCLALFFLQTDMVRSDIRDPDDLVPRIMIAGVGEAGDPCYKHYHMIMAGIEFMQQVLPRTPHEYTDHEHKMARQWNRKLQPYSIMEVRRVEAPPKHHNSASGAGPDAEVEHHSPFTHSFFQKRHKRRLREPRKSDGLQVIRVAAGQKCKHLPLLPDSVQKVTRVSR